MRSRLAPKQPTTAGRVDLDGDVSLTELIGLEREIGEMRGRAVDAVPAANLEPSLASHVLTEPVPL